MRLNIFKKEEKKRIYNISGRILDRNRNYVTGQLKSIEVTITSASEKGYACTYIIQRRHRSACGDGFGTATVFCNFQCRGVQLIWIIVEYKGSMCLQQVRAGRGVVGHFLHQHIYFVSLFQGDSLSDIDSKNHKTTNRSKQPAQPGYTETIFDLGRVWSPLNNAQTDLSIYSLRTCHVVLFLN